jgi:uncharacterized protein YjdB
MSSFDARTVQEPRPWQTTQDDAVAARDAEVLLEDVKEAKAVAMSDDIAGVTLDTVTCNVSDVTLTVSQVADLTATLALTGADDRVGLVTANGITFASSDPTKVIVEGDTVRGVAAGSANIKATYRGVDSANVSVTTA